MNIFVFWQGITFSSINSQINVSESLTHAFLYFVNWEKHFNLASQ